MLMPKFSCRLNPIEHQWGVVKHLWGKKLAASHHNLDKNLINDYVHEVLWEVATTKTTYRIMHASDQAYLEVEDGHLV